LGSTSFRLGIRQSFIFPGGRMMQKSIVYSALIKGMPIMVLCAYFQNTCKLVYCRKEGFVMVTIYEEPGLKSFVLETLLKEAGIEVGLVTDSIPVLADFISNNHVDACLYNYDFCAARYEQLPILIATSKANVNTKRVALCEEEEAPYIIGGPTYPIDYKISSPISREKVEKAVQQGIFK